jgi:hypothetical protein
MNITDETVESSPSTKAFEPILLTLNSQPEEPPRPQGHHGWTLMLISAGIGLIACCFLIPQADENRRLAYEGLRLKADLEHLEQQAAVNDEFIRRVGSDPALSERLAQRQMRFVRKGSGVLDLDESSGMAGKSPFSLVAIPPPAAVPTFRRPESRLANLCRNPKSRLYLLGTGLMLLATGLVLGSNQSDD